MAEGAQVTHAGPQARHDGRHSDCPARDTVDHLTSRWGTRVVISLGRGDLRFFQLRESVPGISEKMLTQTLRTLVQDGLVRREVRPTTPPQVTYGLTEFGREIGGPLEELFELITRRLVPPGAGDPAPGR